MNAGLSDAGYKGVRSTPAIFVSYMDVYMHSIKTLAVLYGEENDLTEHDRNVREKEDQVDQIMLALPDGQDHYDGLAETTLL